MIELSNSKKKSTQLMGKFSKLLHQHMEKDKMLRFIRILNTTSTKIMILEHYRDVFRRDGRNQNGHHV